MYTYLILNFIVVIPTLVIPIFFGQDLTKNIKYSLKTVLVSASFFLIWDYLFTINKIWGFNPQYLTGIYLLNLPVEEVLFFISVPMAVLFVYQLVKKYIPDLFREKLAHQLFFIIILSTWIIALSNLDKTYTWVCFISLGIFSAFAWYKSPPWSSTLLSSFLLILGPFVLVNGILTRGVPAISNQPVVWYNNSENLDVRFGTIPIEDFAYTLIIFLVNVPLFEKFLPDHPKTNLDKK